MSVKVGLAAATQDVSFFDSIATSHANTSYCGTRTYTILPPHTFLTITGTTMRLYTANVLDVGTYYVALIISLADYYQVSPITKNLIVNISCEV